MRRFRKRLILAALLATTMSVTVASSPASADQTCLPSIGTVLCFPF